MNNIIKCLDCERPNLTINDFYKESSGGYKKRCRFCEQERRKRIRDIRKMLKTLS